MVSRYNSQRPFVTADKLQELFKMYTIGDECDYAAKIVGVHEGVNSILEITFRGRQPLRAYIPEL